MKTKFLFALVFGILMLSLTANFISAETNLIDNPGFESGLQDWKTGCWWENTCGSTISDSVKHSGEKSIKLTAEGIDFGEPYAATSAETGNMIELEENEEYKLEAWFNFEDGASIDTQVARLLLVLYESEEDWENNAYTTAPERVLDFNEVVKDSENGAWTKISLDFETDDEHVFARVWLIGQAQPGTIQPNQNPEVTVWFDDVSLTKVGGDDGDDGDGDNGDENDKNKRKQNNFFLTEDSCFPSWDCTGWSACTDGTRTRQCTDLNSCEFAYNKPKEATGCVVEDLTEPVLIEKQSEANYFFWAMAGLLVFLVLLLIVLSMSR